jgi:hypothetical protein
MGASHNPCIGESAQFIWPAIAMPVDAAAKQLALRLIQAFQQRLVAHVLQVEEGAAHRDQFARIKFQDGGLVNRCAGRSIEGGAFERIGDGAVDHQPVADCQRLVADSSIDRVIAEVRQQSAGLPTDEGILQP